MKVIVDIPKKYYEDFKLQLPILNKKVPSEIAKYAIANGIPLPKGHGRIKDIDKIEWYGCTTAFDCPYKDRECKDCDRAECSKTQVDDIPTIIEADTESEEEK